MTTEIYVILSIVGCVSLCWLAYNIGYHNGQQNRADEAVDRWVDEDMKRMDKQWDDLMEKHRQNLKKLEN